MDVDIHTFRIGEGTGLCKRRVVLREMGQKGENGVPLNFSCLVLRSVVKFLTIFFILGFILVF